MVVIDIPVETGKDTVARGLDIITLPGTRRKTVGVLHIGRKTLQLTELRTSVCDGIWRSPISST